MKKFLLRNVLNVILLWMHDKQTNREIKRAKFDTIIIEPTVICNIQCTHCATNSERINLRNITPSGRKFLKSESLKDILKYLNRNKVSISNIEFQGFGEPLLAKNLPSLISTAKQVYPFSRVSLITNGNADNIADSVLKDINHLIFSIDGINQDTYEPYRQKGNYERALCLLKNAVKYRDKYHRDMKIVWKYIIFTHNENEESLQEAARTADAIKVDELRFVLSQIGPVSKKFHQFAAETNHLFFPPDSYCSQYESISIEKILSKCTTLNIRNPFPPFIGYNIAITVFYVMANNLNVYKAIDIAKNKLSNGDIEEAGNFLKYASTILRRMYSTESINFSYLADSHVQLVKDLLNLSNLLSNKQNQKIRCDIHELVLALYDQGNLSGKNSKEVECSVVVRNDLVEKEGTYFSTGNDPIFEITPFETCAFSGPLTVVIDIDYQGTCPGISQIYYNTGQGYNETESIRIDANSGRQEYLIPTEKKIKNLRFDPANKKECQFRIGKIFLVGNIFIIE